METIIPSSELRNKYSEISKKCKETREPIFLTVNGRGDCVIMDIEDYNQMKAELELLRSLAIAEEDISLGRIAPIEDTFNSLRKKLN